MNESALEVLKHNLTINQTSFGYSPHSLADWILLNSKNKNNLNRFIFNNLDKDPISRDLVFAKISDEKVTAIECVINILSWGGIRRSNALKAFENSQIWLPICEKIRDGKLSRQEAYDNFIYLRNKSNLNGMGPAFFTKLIFYFMNRRINSGYIMDQWTSRSINLLFSTDVVKCKLINKNKTNEYAIVSDNNNSENYEEFCLCVEKIAKLINLSPEATELSLFSEGRGLGVWRNYVKTAHH